MDLALSAASSATWQLYALIILALLANGFVFSWIGLSYIRELMDRRLSEDRGPIHRLIGRQATFETRVRERTRRLQDEAEQTEALAALHKDQAEAVRRLLGAELARETRRVRRDSIIIAIASFVAGSSVSVLVTLLIHPNG